MNNKVSFMNKIILLVLLFLNESLFFLYDISKLIKIIFIVLSFVLFVVIILKDKNKKKYNFKYEIIIFLALVAVEPLNAQRMFNQPLSIGYQFIGFYFAYLDYFYISYLFRNKIDGQKVIEDLIIFVSIVGGIIYGIQYVKYPSIILKGIDYRLNSRFGQARLYIPTGLYLLSYYISMMKIFFKKGNLVINILCISLDLFILIYATQTRMIVFSVIAGSIIMFILLINKLSLIKKILLFIMIIGVSFYVASSTSFLQDSTITKMIDMTNQDDNSYTTRLDEIKFYENEFTNNIIFGRGEISSVSNPIENGVAYQYFIEDVGLIGTIFKWGILGLIIIIIAIIKIIQILIMFYDKDNYTYYISLGFFISILLMSFTVSYIDINEQIFELIIALGYLDLISDKKINNNYTCQERRL